MGPGSPNVTYNKVLGWTFYQSTKFHKDPSNVHFDYFWDDFEHLYRPGDLIVISLSPNRKCSEIPVLQLSFHSSLWISSSSGLYCSNCFISRVKADKICKLWDNWSDSRWKIHCSRCKAYGTDLAKTKYVLLLILFVLCIVKMLLISMHVATYSHLYLMTSQGSNL